MFNSFGEYMFRLLFGPLRKVTKKANQFYIFFKVIGRQFDQMKKDIFRVREESDRAYVQRCYAPNPRPGPGYGPT